MKNLKIFGDSIIKGVTYNGQSYHLCQEHDFDTLRAEFLKSRIFPTLIGADGIHPTQAGHDLIHHTVQSALAY